MEMSGEDFDDYEDENLRDDDIEYTKKSEFSKAKVCEDAVRKVEECRSKEMKEGYYNYSTSPNGDMKKVYIPDSRKEFIGSVESLISVLTPEIERDERMQEVNKEIAERKQNLFKKYAVIRIYEDQTGIVEGEKYIPDLDDITPVKYGKLNARQQQIGTFIENKKGLYNYNVKCYWNGIVEIYDYIFAELNKLIASKKVNFFKQGASF